jgi:hypothetical protein
MELDNIRASQVSGCAVRIYQAVQAQFTPEEQLARMLLIVTINGWNRVQVGFHAVHPTEKREVA